MRIHYLQHGLFDKPEIIEEWANINGHLFAKTITYVETKLPDVEDFDLLIVSGGTQSLLNSAEWLHLKDELKLIKKVIDADKAVLGICLGAQLVAESLGAKTQKSLYPEIGVYPVKLLPEARNDPVFSRFPEEFTVMHMHYDMFGLPNGAQLLARSNGCAHQAFRFGEKIYGLQFHLEMTRENIKERLLHHKENLITDLYISSRQELAKYDPTEINKKMLILLDYFNQTSIRGFC